MRDLQQQIIGQQPATVDSPYPGGTFINSRDANGNILYTQVDSTGINSTTSVCEITATSQVTTPSNTNTFTCIPTGATLAGLQTNTAIGSTIPAFKEFFRGNSPKPRISVGIGVNWNSPFGPFRIDFAKTLLKVDGDVTKSFTFNVGTQF